MWKVETAYSIRLHHLFPNDDDDDDDEDGAATADGDDDDDVDDDGDDNDEDDDDDDGDDDDEDDDDDDGSIFDTTAPSHYTVRWVSLQWRRWKTCETANFFPFIFAKLRNSKFLTIYFAKL